MRVLILFFVLLSSAVAEARIVVLTSFSKESEQRKVERKFRQRLDLRAGEELQIIHKADQWVLHQSLQDTTVHALFWISHGVSGRTNQTVEGATLLPKLIDYRGDNVAPIFNLIGPAIKFISIIGCNSAAILEHYDVDVSGINHYIPVNRRVAAQRQIPRAISAFRSADLNLQRPSPVDVTFRGHVTVSREVRAAPEVRSLRVYSGDQLLGLLPASSSTASFAVAADNNLKIKFETGQDPSVAQGEFGVLSVASPDISGEWRLFQNAQGVPFGVNHRLFIYRN